MDRIRIKANIEYHQKSPSFVGLEYTRDFGYVLSVTDHNIGMSQKTCVAYLNEKQLSDFSHKILELIGEQTSNVDTSKSD